MNAENPKELAEYQNDHDLLVALNVEMRGLRQDFKEAKANYVTRDEFAPVKETYVSRIEFWPVKMLVYGCVGIMLSTLMLALIYLVVQH